MYNLVEYSDNYSKTYRILWQYCNDIPAVANNSNIVEFNGANATDSFNFKAKITGQTDNTGRIDNVEIMIPLKYWSNFWKTLEMPLIVKLILFNCDLNRGCFVYMFSLRFSGRKLLINLLRQFRVRKFFVYKVLRDLQSFHFVFKIITVFRKCVTIFHVFLLLNPAH